MHTAAHSLFPTENNSLNQAIKSSEEGAFPGNVSMAEKMKLTLSGSLRTTSLERTRRDNLQDRLRAVEQKVEQLTCYEKDLLGRAEVKETGDLYNSWKQLESHINSAQTEVQLLSSQVMGDFKLSSQDIASLPTGQMLGQIRNLRAKLVRLRHVVQANRFFSLLKELNDWVSHCDATFSAVSSSARDGQGSIVSQQEALTNLIQEMEKRRSQIDQSLQQGFQQYGDVELELGQSIDAEFGFGLDAADFPTKEVTTKGAPAQTLSGRSGTEGHRDPSGSATDETDKRMDRRIRRHLFYLKEHWQALDYKVAALKEQIDTALQRLKNLNGLFDETACQIRSAQNVVLRWTPVEYLPVNRLEAELAHTQSFYEACEPLKELLNNLDRQSLQLQGQNLVFEPSLHCIRSHFERVCLQTEARLRSLGQSIPVQRFTPMMQQPSSGLSEGSAKHSLSQTLSARSQILSDTVSSPWERCVHPSGTQVPYYKNHATQETQWDHPILADVMRSMKQLNSIVFAKYRTAMKLRRLQSSLCLDVISLSIIAEHMKHIGHTQTFDCSVGDLFDRTVNVPQIIDCLLKLFTSANAAHGVTRNEFEVSQRTPTSPFEVDTGRKQKKSLQQNVTPLSSARPGEQPSTRASSRTGRGVTRSASTSSYSNSHSTNYAPAASSNTETERNDTLTAQSSMGEHKRSQSIPGCGMRLHNQSDSSESQLNRRRSRRLSRSRQGRSSSKRPRQLTFGPTRHPTNVCVDLTLNWLLNVFDRTRKGFIQALSLKVALTIMSVANVEDKFRYLFSLIADHDGCVSEQRLAILLNDCCLIPQNLGEGRMSGSEQFNSSVKASFNQVLELAKEGDLPHVGSPYYNPTIPVRHFLTWIFVEPSTMLAWLPLLHRLMLAESVLHHVKCDVCHTQPISGFRYRCLRCLNFDLCQECFLTGRTARSHKAYHPMQEYCNTSSSTDSFRDFTHIVRNRFRSRDGLKSIPADPTSSPKISASREQSFKSRRQLCDMSGIVDNKPRLAPVFHADDVNQTPPPTSAYQSPQFDPNETVNRQSSVIDLGSFQAISQQHQPHQDKVNGINSNRPGSSIPNASMSYHHLTVRSASENQGLLEPTRYYSHANCIAPLPSGESENRVVDTKPDQEHNLIACYSRELRQKGEFNGSPAYPEVGVNLMNRSTISDGMTTRSEQNPGDTTHSLHSGGAGMASLRTGHLSLDRHNLLGGGRVKNQSPQHLPPQNGYSAYPTIKSPQGYNGMVAAGPPNPTVEYNHNPAVNNPHTMTTGFRTSFSRDPIYELCIPNVQRSYSLRARSQPPPDVQQFYNVRQTSTTPLGDWRSPWHQNSTVNTYSGHPFSIAQENEKIDMDQYEARLANRGMKPTQWPQPSARNVRNYPVYAHHQQPSDQMRTAYYRGLMPRVSRLPGPPLGYHHNPNSTGIPSFVGRMDYTCSLGRANQVPPTNKLRYSAEMCNSEPRVAMVAGPTFNEHLVDNGSIDYTALLASGEKASEARRLKEHKDRLEARMQLLEEQNRQLNSTMTKLRQQIDASGTSSHGERTKANITSGAQERHASDSTTSTVPVEQRLQSGIDNSSKQLRSMDNNNFHAAPSEVNRTNGNNANAVTNPARPYSSGVKKITQPGSRDEREPVRN